MSNLLDAAHKGDIAGIQEALKHGASLAEKNNGAIRPCCWRPWGESLRRCSGC